MTIPGQYILQNHFNGDVGQPVFGPPNIVGGVFGPTTNLAVPAAQIQEVALAGPIPADFANLPVGTPVFPWLAGAAGAAEVIPYARVSAPGVVTLATGNLAAAPAGFGPVAPLVWGAKGAMLHQLPLQGAVLAGAAAQLSVPSLGAIATRQSAELPPAGVIIANTNTLIIANPVNALPAGFMLAYARPDVFTIPVALANLTAAPADPGATDWRFHTIAFDNTICASYPSGQNGPVALNVIQGVTVPFGVIAGATVVEGTVAIADLNPQDGVIVVPRSAMPEAKMCPSHSRCSVAGTLSWGIANLDPAVATAAHDIVCDIIVAKPLPIF